MTSLDPYILQQASCQANLLVSTIVLRSDDWEDPQQELVLDLLHRSRRFDPARGDWYGFVRGVARNQAAVLVMRGRRREPEVLGDDLVNREEAGDPESLDVLNRGPSSAVVDALHLSLNGRRVIQSLPPRLQALAILLGEMPVQDVCQRTGKFGSRVYQMTLELTAAFVRAGLRRKQARKAGVQR